jgi:hypothetical protein
MLPLRSGSTTGPVIEENRLHGPTVFAGPGLHATVHCIVVKSGSCCQVSLIDCCMAAVIVGWCKTECSCLGYGNKMRAS